MTTLQTALPATTRPPARGRLGTHYVGGRDTEATGERVLEHTDPATGSTNGSTVAATSAEATAAVDAAVAAGKAWRATSPSERAAGLRKGAAAIRSVADELAELLCASTGRLLSQCRDSAVVAADLLEEAAVTGLVDAGRALPGDASALDVVRRQPRGVVAVLTPWNDPYPAAAGLLAAALITGNTVVHKPSERSALPGWRMARTLAGCLPAGVLNVLNGDGSTGAAVVGDARVALVAHVGSTASGRLVAASAGARGARVLLENGGNDPVLVDEGVDPVWAAEQIALGAFTNTGQLCTSVERVYLHRAVADEVLQELVRIAQAMKVGPPADQSTELGPLVDQDQLAVVESHVRSAVEAGARCLTGGERLETPGCFYPPTVLDGCHDDMHVMADETFGPVAAVSRVDTFEEALQRACSGRYGLAATVLTPDLAHALAAASALDVGTVKINAVFGGAPGGSADPRGDSGTGAGYGPDLLREMTVLKAVHLEPARR